MRALLDLLPIGVCITRDDQCQSLEHNRSMRRLFGVDVEAEDTSLPDVRFFRDGRALASDELPLHQAVTAGRKVRDALLDAELPDGTRLSLVAHASPLFDEDGRPRGGLVAFVDVTEARRREEEQRFLAEASALFSEEADVRSILERLVELAVRSVSEWCTLYVLDEHGVARQRTVRHADPARARRAEALGSQADVVPAGSTLDRALRLGESSLIADLEPARVERHLGAPALRALAREEPCRSFMSVPVVGRGHIFAALVFASTSRRFTEADLRIAEDLGRRAGLAAANAALMEAEQRSRREAERAAQRMARLQSVTATLSNELSRDRIAEIVIDEGTRALGAHSGALWLLDRERPRLALLRAVGVPRSLEDYIRDMPLVDDRPFGRAVLQREPVWLERDYADEFPDLEAQLRRCGITERLSFACLPLVVDGHAIGGLCLAFDDARRFDKDERGFLSVLAQSCADALERAHLFDAERRACARAEGVAMRLAHLNAVMAELARATTLEAIGAVLTDDGVTACGASSGALFVLPEGASTLDLVGGNATVGAPPPLGLDLATPLAEVVRTRAPVWIASREELRARFPDAAGALDIGPGSALRVACAPLVVDGVARGAVVFTFGFGTGFESDERLFVELLARTCSHALERALLLEDERRALAALEDANRRLRRLFESSMVGIGVWQRDGAITEANDGLLRMLGYQRDDLARGRLTWGAIAPRREAAKDARAFAEIERSGVCTPFERTCRRKDGASVPVLIGGANWEGSANSGVFFAIDISEQKRAEETQRFLAEAGRILTSSLDLEVTLKQVVELAVPAFADWCFVHLLNEEDDELERVAVGSRDAARARYFQALPSRVPLAPAFAAARVIQRGEPELVTALDETRWRAEAVDPSHLERLRWIAPRSYIVVPLLVRGESIGALTLSSSRRDFDSSDVERAQELARRASLAIDNAKLHRDTQAAVRTREEFLSVASHELKTPLNSLQLHVQMLMRGFERGGPSPEMLAKSLDAVQRQVARQTKLINELLDVSRVGLGRLELVPEPTDLVALVREVTARFDAELERTKTPLTVVTDDEVVGLWDKSRIDQVVTNLVSNAVKYGCGKPIEVRVEREEQHARLTVKDGGIGIAPEHRSRIFDRFERAVSERHYGGFGLGLWIARQIVEASGGVISVESAAGAGSTFTVLLPRKGASA